MKIHFGFFIRNKLQLNEEEISEKLRQWEIMNFKLKDELKDATQQLLVRSEDLISSKADLVKHRLEIDVRFFIYFYLHFFLNFIIIYRDLMKTFVI